MTSLQALRLQSLLAYLVLHRGTRHRRQQLAFLFWPDASETHARNNLRQMLHELRHGLPNVDTFIHADVATLYWQAEAPLRLDVAEFEQAIAAAESAERTNDWATMRSALAHAAALYASDLLPSCYDEWIIPERERLRQHLLWVLERLIGALERQRNYGAAIDYAQRLLRYDPLREESYRHLMRLYALTDDPIAALRIYHACETTLQRELDVEPSPSTREAYERLRHVGRLPVRPEATNAPAAPAVPLIGREQEWTWLHEAWRRAAGYPLGAAPGGSPHFAVVSGEAGIGKSRFAEEFLVWAGQQGFATARARAYAAEGQLAYAPVADWLRSDALRPALARLDAPWRTEVARLLPELKREQPQNPSLEPRPDHGQRQRFFQALARAILSVNRSLLLLLDDLQWCDQDTLEWLHYLLRFDRQARLLVVGTLRTEDVRSRHHLAPLLGDLRAAGQITEIALGPLDTTETMTLAAHVAGRAFDPIEAEDLYRETEGNPLFVVEAVRAESVGDDQRLATEERRLAPKVQAVIAARLAQLSDPAREVATVAATIGRAFTLDVLILAGGGDEDRVVDGLDELWQRHIVREQGANAYGFSHDKIREVAYADSSPVRRRLLHRHVAEALRSVNAADLDPVSSQIATHYEAAGMAEQAILQYQRAAEVAQRVYANEAAIRLLRKGLALLASLPPSQEREAHELQLQTALGVSLVASWGYGSGEVMLVLSRSRALSQRLRKPPSPPILRALAIACVTHAEFQQAHDLGDQLLSLATRDQDPVLRVEAHYALGVTLFWKGAFASSRTHLEQAVVHYDVQRSPTHIALYTQDPEGVSLLRLALGLWCLGYPEQAHRRSQEAVACARKRGHPFSLAYVLTCDAWLHNLRRDARATREQAETDIMLCREHQIDFWLPFGLILQGWARAEQGELEAGIGVMREAMTAFRGAGAEYMRPYFLGLLAEQYDHLGNAELSLTLVAEALAAVERTGERWYEAELYRRRGEFLLRGGDEDAAEAAFLRALAVARYQEAKAFELRAAMSLCRLRSEKRAEAHHILAETYTWFSEGFDTPDLADARVLLAQP